MTERKPSSVVETETSEKSDEPPLIEPLTRKGRKRLAKTERQLSFAITLDVATLLENTKLRDESAPGYLCAEALVYFIRRSIRNNDSKMRDILIRELLDRCQPFFRGKFRGFDRYEREDLQGDVMKKMAEDLLSPDDRGDYMQERFWDYLEKKTVDACREAFRHSGETEGLDTGFTGDGDSEGRTQLEKQADVRLSPEDLAMLSEALATLPLKLREVFLLRHYVGMNIGADNPADDPEHKLTIAKHFDCSGRTVRNWLKEADTLLAGFREKQNG